MSKTINKLCIMYLVDNKLFTTKMSRVRFHAIETIAKYVDVIWWGPGWDNFDANLDLDNNLKKINKKIDLIFAYKPLGIKGFADVKIPKCISYNEMWDVPATLQEINGSQADLIICHHQNDMVAYSDMLKRISKPVKLIHIPHCAKKEIFYDYKLDKKIDILLCGTIGDPKHYPLRNKLVNVLKKINPKYNCQIYKHPGYIHSDSYTDIYLVDFAKALNSAKICVTCSSKYKYRLGKYVEIPMCNSVLAGDIPAQDEEEFNKFMIEINNNMTEEEIVKILESYLTNETLLNKKKQLGYEWSLKYTQEYYSKKFIEEVNIFLKEYYNKKIFVIGDELNNIKEKWICDVLKEEFMAYNKNICTSDPHDADIIWLLAPWSYRKLPKDILEKKYIISTIHHIDQEKFNENKEYYEYLDKITNRYHVICQKTYDAVKKITKKQIDLKYLWVNPKNFYHIDERSILRKKYKLPKNGTLIGSFQKDSEGKDESVPKFSKGPDIFIKIVADMYKKNPRIHVVLTGWRRTYVINELNKLGVKYNYYELIDPISLNELYNCLNLYVVSSRVEGGPRSIVECALAKVPIISTDVGIATKILSSKSIYDMNTPISYFNTTPDVKYAYNNVSGLTIAKYMGEFKDFIYWYF